MPDRRKMPNGSACFRRMALRSGAAVLRADAHPPVLTHAFEFHLSRRCKNGRKAPSRNLHGWPLDSQPRLRPVDQQQHFCSVSMRAASLPLPRASAKA